MKTKQEFIATATHSTSSGRVEFTGTAALTELLGRFGSGRLVHLYAADTLERLSRDKMNLAADIVEVATLRDKLLRDRDEKIERLSQLFEQERNVSDTQALLIERLTTERDALKADAERYRYLAKTANGYDKKEKLDAHIDSAIQGAGK